MNPAVVRHTHSAERASSPKQVKVTIHLCIPDEQERFLPKRLRAPRELPPGVPRPSIGEVIFLASNSAWLVTAVIHDWKSLVDLRVEVWLAHVADPRHSRPVGFALTQ